ncbi:hypothetical protein JCM4814A_89100 [Streptomyces phaeofaciens JCM 4814]|uniref:DUF485 domain-containing protein n=1 Tax=Streptomyces phaeofaciens TaxID=68254 RepID=A0A918LZS6_9ACTN|nr:DUF485 domain-containing protein [Streptomyces phaeofaciens]GGT79721.1 hypothetical protein GCM10010226_67560 [Streptomyces phaeofaciens]
MTYPDDRRYPQPDWPQPSTEPYGRTPGYGSYGRGPGQEPSRSGYDDSPHDRYGQAARHEPYAHQPYAHETHRHGADLAALRSAYRVLRRVSTLTALGSFVVYVVLSCYATELMGARITGELSLGMALGILQLVVTFAAVFSYGRSARRSVDPLARVVRERAAGRTAGVAR